MKTNTSVIANNNMISSLLSDLNKKMFLICNLERDDRLDFFIEDHLLVFLLDGVLQFSMDKSDVLELKAPAVFLIKRGTFYERKALVNSRIVILPIFNYEDIGEISALEMFEVEPRNTDSVVKTEKDKMYLKLTPIILNFFKILIHIIDFGIMDSTYFDMKVKELSLIANEEYSKEELTSFFASVVGTDRVFLDFIYANYKNVRNIKELADLSNYSQTGFEKKFHKVFGETPSGWLRARTSIDIYDELIKSTKPFKEISLDFGFSSPSHFNNFCKNTLGGTPGELRKQIIIPGKFKQL